MKRLLLLSSGVFLFSTAQSQTYKVKTIFQLLNVQDTRKPLNTPATAEKTEEILLEESKVTVDEARTGPGYSNAATVFAPLAEWLKVHPAGKGTPVPEVLMNLNYKSPIYDSKLEYTSAGCQVVTDYGETKPLGKLFYVPAGKTGAGFNVLDKEKNSRYYDAAGHLLFDRKFSYVEADRNNYRFYEGKKCGIADSTGKVLLPAEYDEVYSFVFNKQIWFSVQKGEKIYFLEPGNSKPVMENEAGRATFVPEITANRYWVTNGRVYDMLKREELFASINKEIHLWSSNWPLFYIKRDGNGEEGKEEIYFDAAGNLLLGQPVAGHNGLSDTTSIMKLFVKDTIVNKKKYTLMKSGIIHDKGRWITKPVYDLLEEVGRTNTLAYFTNWQTRNPGLMDAAGKILIPEGRFWNIEEGARDGQYVCYNDTASLLWERKTGRYSPLPKKYFVFRCFGELEKIGMMEGITTDNKHYLLDTNYNLLDTTGWADISIPSYRDGRQIALLPYIDGKRDYYAEKLFKTAGLETLSFTWNGTAYNTFTDVDSIAPGAYFFQRKDKKNIVQVKPGQYFMTSCEMIQYDPFFNWYIGRMRNNRWGVLDETGKELLPFVFDRVQRYSNWFGTAQITAQGNLLQIDRNGKLLFDGSYNNVIPVTRDFFIVEKDGRRGLLNRSGKEILPVTYGYMGTGMGSVWYGDDENTTQYISIGSLQGKE